MGHESEKIKWELVPFTRGRGLDIGCGPYKPFPHFRGVDNNKDESLFGVRATAADWIVPDASELSDFASATQDFVFSSHCLEHIEDHKKALKEWWRVLRPGGHLVLYLPHAELYPKIGEEGANPDHKHDFMPEDIIEVMKEIGGWDLLRDEKRAEEREYSFFQVYKKYSEAKIHRFTAHKPKPEKTCAIIRYGAYGDVIQSTTLLPALKAEGYHVTLYTTPRAYEAVKHEPNIDAFVLQDDNQVPNAELGPYWDYLKKNNTKFINLSESVEASLLAMPDRMPYQWDTATRHKYMNLNYWEFTHNIARIEFKRPQSRFYATDEEKKWAKKERAKLGADPLVMWVLRGSSLHKVWSGGEDADNGATGFDGILARIMLQYPNAKVITCGDKSCAEIIEAPWVNEDRIVKRSGVWTIRQTMAMAQVCDVVIGPETGVMSAVAMEPMKKIVFMSHSSVDNLTRDWVNTVSLVPVNTECYPCHKLIWNWSQCNQDGESGIAKCQASITPAVVWDALREELDRQEAA